MFIIVPLLYFVILNMLLVITAYFSLKIVKNTIGKNIKEQFNKKLFRKVFWYTVVYYVTGIISLAFLLYNDFAFYLGNVSVLIIIVLFPIYCIVGEPYLLTNSMTNLAITVLSTFFVSIIFNYFVVFKKIDLTKPKRFYAALIVSAMTAPYFYFVPFGGLIY